jgi:hypothetical protein
MLQIASERRLGLVRPDASKKAHIVLGDLTYPAPFHPRSLFKH